VTRPRLIPLLPLATALVLIGCGERDRTSDAVSSVDTTWAPQAPTVETDPAASLQSLPPPPLRSLEELLSLERTPPVEFDLGTLYLRRGELDSAIVHYRRGAEGDPDNPVGWNYLGIALARAGRLQEARTAYLRAVDADAFHLETHINLGNLSYREEDWQGAIREYRIATSIDTTVAKLWLNMGLAYHKLKDRDQAGRSLGRAAKLAPRDPLPWELLGNLYFEQQLYRAAGDAWAEAIQRDPGRTDLIDNLRTLQAWMDSVNKLQQ
jgi:Flp pilus assembly protein TadD